MKSISENYPRLPNDIDRGEKNINFFSYFGEPTDKIATLLHNKGINVFTNTEIAV